MYHMYMYLYEYVHTYVYPITITRATYKQHRYETLCFHRLSIRRIALTLTLTTILLLRYTRLRLPMYLGWIGWPSMERTYCIRMGSPSSELGSPRDS